MQMEQVQQGWVQTSGDTVSLSKSVCCATSEEPIVSLAFPVDLTPNFDLHETAHPPGYRSAESTNIIEGVEYLLS